MLIRLVYREKTANFRCNYGYAFETSQDMSLYELQQVHKFFWLLLV